MLLNHTVKSFTNLSFCGFVSKRKTTADVGVADILFLSLWSYSVFLTSIFEVISRQRLGTSVHQRGPVLRPPAAVLLRLCSSK